MNRLLVGSFAILTVFAYFAMASTTHTSRIVSFPSEISEAVSPDGRFAVVNVDSDSEPNHTLFLENRRTKDRRKLMNYGRHVEVLWNPQNAYFAITDYAGSNVAECLIFAVAGGEPVNVTDQIQQGIKNAKELAILSDNHHVYYAAVSWIDSRSLRVKVWGHGDASPNGFTRFYTYHLHNAR